MATRKRRKRRSLGGLGYSPERHQNTAEVELKAFAAALKLARDQLAAGDCTGAMMLFSGANRAKGAIAENLRASIPSLGPASVQQAHHARVKKQSEKLGDALDRFEDKLRAKCFCKTEG